MADTIVQVENLSKKYIIQHLSKERYTALRDVLARRARAVGRKITHPIRNKLQGKSREEFWALKDISFEVGRGDVIGIIGRNGAGKSTLLKILSRITEPTTGRIRLKGRVASLLEVGTGFHPELTGRENIFLNGAILGMSKSEIRRKFDEIVSFAEVERFLDTPVKRYSSGMYVRLAFAVAAHLEPDLLLVDEVLSVGDASFQKKCLGKMRGFAEGHGRTVFLVSHNMGAIKSLCNRVIVIDQGRIIEISDPSNAISSYYDITSQGLNSGKFSQDKNLVIKKVILSNQSGEITNSFTPGEDLNIRIEYNAKERIKKPHFWVSIKSTYGNLFAAIMMFDGSAPEYIEGENWITCRFISIPLLPQQYHIRMGVRDSSGVKLLIDTQDVAYFHVTGSMTDIGFKGELADNLSWNAANLCIPYEWHFPDGKQLSFSINNT